LANVSVYRSWKWGTMAAMFRWRLPWFIVFYQSMCVLCAGSLLYHGKKKLTTPNNFPTLY
jgi:hypothetical protein